MDSGNLDQAPPWAAAMLAEARVARLGLLDANDHPRVLPVTFALAGDAIVSAVDEKPKRTAPDRIARVRYLRRRPEAALTVDRYSEDWSELAWVQVLGRVEVIEAADDPESIAALREKYPPYRDRPPAGPLLRLRPERALWWRAAGD